MFALATEKLAEKLSVPDHNLPTFMQKVSGNFGIIIKHPLVNMMFNCTKADAK